MKEAFDVKDDNIVCSVFSELKALGVKVPTVKKFKSGVPKHVKDVASSSGKIFGVPICQQEKISIDDYVLPKFVFASTSYLKRFSAVEIGLFRKAGSITRQKDLRVKLERGESIENSEPNDVASLLKQWLRELPDPLIPVYLQDLFIRCQKLQIEENRIAALLLCCHLLPFEHLQTLKYLLEFLFEMATNSDRNKMGAHNLALIMAPNIFVWGEHSIDKSSNDLVQLHTSILELLINNVQRIVVTSPCLSSHSLESKSLRNSTDLDLSLDALDYSPSKSKKRRSGPFQGKMSCPLDLFTGIRKLVGQNSTSSPIPSKKWNQDNKLVPDTAPRSASKRKADPEQLSLSPLKKQATNTRNILQSVGSNFTPVNKCSQNTFANGKEKTGSAHSRKKSFGLLRRKDKKNRQKSSKPNEVLVNKEESKVNTSPSSPFEEHLSTLQKPEEDKSSPLLSTSDIERILSRSTFTKKSVSDCYLTFYDNEYQKRPVFSTSSSEGCLHSHDNNSPYNLRSSASNRKPLKRKSGVLNEVSMTNKENARQRSSPRLKSISPVAIYSFPQQESANPKDATFIIKNNSNSREKDSTLSANDFDVIDSFHSVQKRLNSGEQKTMNLKDARASFPHKTENPQGNSGNDETTEANVQNSTATDISLNLPPFDPFIVDNEDKIKRQCSLRRQEAFAVRSKNCKKMNSSQIRRADSIKIANSKSKNLINLGSENLSASAKNLNVQLDSADKRRLKRKVRNGSIVRGRPNTVRTGLPSDLSSKYNNESISTDPKNQVSPTSPTDKILFTNVVNELEINDASTLKTPNITVSTPCVEVISKKNDGKEDVNSSFQTTISLDVRKTKIVSKKKCRERIYSNSDSKVHKMKTRSGKVARIHSFPQNSIQKPKVLRVQELKLMNISKHKKSEGKMNTPVQNGIDKENTPVQKGIDKENTPVQNEIRQENTLAPESPLSTYNDHVFKTPSANFQTPETWFSGREFFESEDPKDDDAGNKRESIAMILKNKQGHVQQKVHMYDHRSRSSSTSTPSMTRSARRVESLYDPQYSSMKTKLSEKRSTSVRSKKSLRNKHSPLPPPPKFVLPDSPTTLKPSYPLKELTNISGTDNTPFSPSPSKTSFINTPNKDSTEKMKRKCTLKPKRNSYSGHTPYRLPKDRHKVLRSESSPLLQKPLNKSSQKQLECVKVSPFSAVIDQDSMNSLDRNFHEALNFKTKSSLSIDKLRLDQLTDEWHCEM